MRALCRALVAALAFVSLAGPARADDLSPGWQRGTTDIDLAGGYELEALGESTHSSILRQSGTRLVVSFSGVSADWVGRGGASATLAFVPLYVVLDPNVTLETIGLGRSVGMTEAKATFRKIVGALLEATYNPNSGAISFRGHLAGIDYDREKGFWDWRVLDASVVVAKSFAVGAETRFDLELSVGASIGGVEMGSLASLENALNLAPRSDSALTIDPIALARAGFSARDWRISLVLSGAQRIDITPNRPRYLGHEVSASSQRARASLDGEVTMWHSAATRDGGGYERSLAVFGSIVFDYDNLTLVRMLVGNNDFFLSAQPTIGVRGRF